MRRQLLYEGIMLVWTAMLIFGIAYFAQIHLKLGGFVSALWMLTLFAFGFRMGRVGDREMLRQVNVVGLSLTMLGALSVILAGKLALRRIRLRTATSQLSLTKDKLSAVMLTVLTKNGEKYGSSLWPTIANVLSWVWATMMFFSFLFLMYLHLVSGPKGWLFLILGVGVLFAAFIVGRSGLWGTFTAFMVSTASSRPGGDAGADGNGRV